MDIKDLAGYLVDGKFVNCLTFSGTTFDETSIITPLYYTRPTTTAQETIGAKIRNRLSPYKNLIEMVGIFPEEVVLEDLRSPTHKQCIEELVALSHECELQPSETLLNILESK